SAKRTEKKKSYFARYARSAAKLPTDPAGIGRASPEGRMRAERSETARQGCCKVEVFCFCVRDVEGVIMYHVDVRIPGDSTHRPPSSGRRLPGLQKSQSQAQTRDGG